MSVILSCLTLWSIDQLTKYRSWELVPGRIKTVLRPTSVRRYLDAIAPRLLTAADDIDVRDLDGEELHDLYEAVIDQCHSNLSKRRTGARLYAFHMFLMTRCGAAAVDFTDLVDVAAPGELRVDANLISPKEFDWIKKVLVPNYCKASRIRKIQYLIAVLGFRCGVRSGEVRKIKLREVFGRGPLTEIVLRNNRFGRLKTTSCIRRIPLFGLLQPEELEQILQWVAQREAEDGAGNGDTLLFCNKGEPTKKLSYHEVISPISEAMRQVCGDDTLHYHHMRHSFANWLLVRLLLDVTKGLRRRFPFLDHPIFDIEVCRNLRRTLLHNSTTRQKALYLVAQLCGHLSPEVTCRHYLHLFDVLLSIDLSAAGNEPELSANAIMAITDLSRGKVNYHRGGKQEPWVMSTFEPHLSGIGRLKSVSLVSRNTTPMPNTKRERGKGELDKHSVAATKLLSSIETVLICHHLKMPLSEIAKRAGVTEGEADSWCETAGKIANMKTHWNKPRHIPSATARANTEKIFPQTLHLETDKTMAKAIMSAFLRQRSANRRKIIVGVRSFIERYYVSGHGFPCSTIAQARRYIRFIQLLEIPLSQVRAIRTMPIGYGNIGDIEYRNLKLSFAVALGLPEDNVVVKVPHSTEASAEGELEIQVISGAGKPHSSYGFRFAMYTIAITQGLAPTCTEEGEA